MSTMTTTMTTPSKPITNLRATYPVAVTEKVKHREPNKRSPAPVSKTPQTKKNDGGDSDRHDSVIDPASPTRSASGASVSKASSMAQGAGDKTGIKVIKPLTTSEVGKLKTGRTINIWIGQPGEERIVLENAFVNVLARFSPYCKKVLIEEKGTRLLIPPGCKDAINFIYRWMLAGGKDSDGRITFEDLHIPDLVLLYLHCRVLEYEPLKERAALRLRWKLKFHLPSLHDMKQICAHIPSVNDAAFDALARVFFQPITHHDLEPWLRYAEEDNNFCFQLDYAIIDLRKQSLSTSQRHTRKPSSTGSRSVSLSSAGADQVALITAPATSPMAPTEPTSTAKEVPRGPRRSYQKQQQPAPTRYIETTRSRPKPLVLLTPPEDVPSKDGRDNSISLPKRLPRNKSRAVKIGNSSVPTAPPPTPATPTSAHTEQPAAATRPALQDVDQNIIPQATEPNQVPTKPKNQGSTVVNYKANLSCHNCGVKGHFSRECSAPRKPRYSNKNTAAKQAADAKTNEIKGLIKDTIETTAKIPKPQSPPPSAPRGPRAYRGNNNNRYRHQRPARVVETLSNGEGITTSAREARSGEITRTGLVI